MVEFFMNFLLCDASYSKCVYINFMHVCTCCAIERKFAEITKVISLKLLNGLAQTAFLMYKKLIVSKITPER